MFIFFNRFVSLANQKKPGLVCAYAVYPSIKTWSKLIGSAWYRLLRGVCMICKAPKENVQGKTIESWTQTSCRRNCGGIAAV